MALLARRRKARTPVGKAIRAWPWVRRGLKAMRFVNRMRRLILIGAGLLALAAMRRVVRRRRAAQVMPPVSTNGHVVGAATARPQTETERNLQAEKSG